MKVTVTVVRSYLKAVGKKIENVEQLTQAEASAFAEELCHKAGAIRATVLAALDNSALLPKHILAHIQAVVGNVDGSAAEAAQVAKDSAEALVKKAASDAAAKQAADDAEAKALADKQEAAAADAAALAKAQAEDDAAAAALSDEDKE